MHIDFVVLSAVRYILCHIPNYSIMSQGLLKARKILEEDFGNIHILFGDPISIREFSDGRVDRSKHSLAPRWVYICDSNVLKTLDTSFN